MQWLNETITNSNSHELSPLPQVININTILISINGNAEIRKDEQDDNRQTSNSNTGWQNQVKSVLQQQFLYLPNIQCSTVSWSLSGNHCTCKRHCIVWVFSCRFYYLSVLLFINQQPYSNIEMIVHCLILSRATEAHRGLPHFKLLSVAHCYLVRL